MHEELEKAKIQALADNTAQSILKNLKVLEEVSEQFKARWIWELLQNARDSAGPEGVSVTVSITGNTLSFSHDGLPFEDENIVHLIYHGTTKLEDKNQIGQFGTGFIYTHLISKKVKVAGRMNNGDEFEFELDRKGSTQVELREAMEKSWSNFLKSLHQPEAGAQNTNAQTRFEYLVESSSVMEIVQNGIHDFGRNIPYVLAFNDEIKSIAVLDNGNQITFSRGKPKAEGNGIRLIPMEEKRGETSVGRHTVVIAEDASVQVGIIVSNDSGHIALIRDLRSPRLFAGFPLLGTESFVFPAIINSLDFEPNEDRTGIFLRDGDAGHSNKRLLVTGCNLFLGLLRYGADSDWVSLPELANLGLVETRAWLDDVWYRNVLKDHVLQQIRDAEILKVLNGSRVRPAESWIPMTNEEKCDQDLWLLASRMREGQERLPIDADGPTWSKNLVSWHRLLEPLTLPESLTIRRMAEMVSQVGDITHLQQLLMSDVNVSEWLNGFYTLVRDAGEDILFQTMSILPNQNGRFAKCNELFLDIKSDSQPTAGLDERLKDIAASVGLDIRSQLMAEYVSQESVLQLLKPKYESSWIDEIVSYITRVFDEKMNDSSFRDASVRMFGWLLENEQWQRLKGYYVFSRVDDPHAASAVITLGSHEKGDDDIPLAPPDCWPDSAQPFADLFPATCIVSDEYLRVCPIGDVWKELASQGYVRVDPVYLKQQTLDENCFLPEDYLAEGETHKSTEPVEITAIAFLEKKDTGIIDSVRSSQKKAITLLRYLLSSVLPTDESSFDVLEVPCECGEQNQHKYFKAGWLIPLKTRTWVPLSDRKRDKPKAESLAALIKDDADLSTMLGTQAGIQMIRALGVSPADLSLRTVAPDEETRLSFIQSLKKITDAVGNDVTKVQTIAEEIKNHPEMYDEIVDKIRVRELTERNRQVGAIVEDLLRTALESQGFRVSRTGIGSDFEVENDVVIEGQEQGIRVEGADVSFLIEVKATSGTDVRMSAMQARTAVKEKQRFVLFVLPSATLTVTEIDLRGLGKFIFDIGENIEPLLVECETLEAIRDSVQGASKGIEVEIGNLSTHFRIGEECWTHGISFDETVQRFLGQPR